MRIRPRRDDDLSALERIARDVHATDGYPPFMPDGDFVGFLDPQEALACWVAEVDARMAGQISLHSASSKEVIALAVGTLGIEESGIGVVARLLVDPAARRLGVAAALLDHSRREALERGLVPILDVVERFAPAIALYEREGWTRLGTVTVALPDGTTMIEHVYAGPAEASTLVAEG